MMLEYYQNDFCELVSDSDDILLSKICGVVCGKYPTSGELKADRETFEDMIFGTVETLDLFELNKLYSQIPKTKGKQND